MTLIAKFCRALAFTFAVMLLACTDPGAPGPESVVREDGTVKIVDRTGKSWDVTHAENVYGLKAENFQYGLGPHAIRPILNPEFLCPGEPAYPDTSEEQLVIGFSMNNEVRAYEISILSWFEVADEVFDSTYVAVAY